MQDVFFYERGNYLLLRVMNELEIILFLKHKLTSCHDVLQPQLTVFDRVQKQIHVVHDYQPSLERVYRRDGVLEQGLFLTKLYNYLRFKLQKKKENHLRTPCPRGIAL